MRARRLLFTLLKATARRLLILNFPMSAPATTVRSLFGRLPPRPAVPVIKVGIAIKFVAEPPGVFGLKRRRQHAQRAVQLARDEALHALAGADDDAWGVGRGSRLLEEPARSQRGLGLAVLAEKWWVADDSVKRALEPGLSPEVSCVRTGV